MSLNKRARMADADTAIVTGGGKGIGKAVAGRLLAQGLRVVIADIDEEAGAETAAELGRFGEIAFVPTDVADEGSVRQLIGHAVDRFGRLDALVNNAGIADPYTGPVEELAVTTWQRLLGVNLTGSFLCTKHAVPHLRPTSGKSLLFALAVRLPTDGNPNRSPEFFLRSHKKNKHVITDEYPSRG